MSGILTRNQLKIFAIITMLCDHTAVILGCRDLYWPLRIVGRVAFPVFAYFLVQGFIHTSNYKRYLLRLGIFAILSEIPFDLAFQGELLEFQYQNVMFTLFIALGMLYFLRKWEANVMLECLVFFAGGFLGWFFRVDYSWFGVMVIGWFYLMRFSKIRGFVYALPFFLHGGIEVFGAAGAWCCLLHQENKEARFQLPKYFFYMFYPVHLLLLWGIRGIIG